MNYKKKIEKLQEEKNHYAYLASEWKINSNEWKVIAKDNFKNMNIILKIFTAIVILDIIVTICR